MPDTTLVYPAHDYKGETISTIGEERLHNPRLQVNSIEQYVELMNSLDLPNPKMMDVAVPANIAIGHRQTEAFAPDEVLTVKQASGYLKDPGVVWVDLREDKERKKEGFIPGSVYAPYPHLENYIDRNSPTHKELFSGTRRIIFYCAFGERSALAVQTAKEKGLSDACHLIGGLDAWKKAGQPTNNL